MANYLVTGANGFVGRRVLQHLLNKGHTPIALIQDRNRKTDKELLERVSTKGAVVIGSICDRELVRRVVNQYELDYIIHLAAKPIVQQCNSDPYTAYQVNVIGTLNLLEAVRDEYQNNKRLQKVIVMSSDKSYGDSSPIDGYTEDTPFQVTDSYCTSKACEDMIGRSYAKTYGLPICVVRCGNLYGGGDLNLSRLIPGTILRLLNNQQPVLYTDAGNMVREFVHVSDAISAYDIILEKGVLGEAYNIGGTTPYKIKTVLEALREKINNKLEIRMVERHLFEINYQALNAEKLKSLGWEAKTNLDNGLSEAIEWYTKWLATVNGNNNY